MSAKIFLVMLFCSSHTTFAYKPQDTLRTVVEWKQLDFEFPDNNERDLALKEKRFIPENCFPLDVDIDYKGSYDKRIFVTIPRLRQGVPVSLGTVTNKNSPKGPLIKPYPNYEWHKSYGNDCNGITSVFRVMIDDCKRLWVLDTGKVAGNWKCSPQLLVFDLTNDQLLSRYKIPENQYRNSSLFVTPLLDVKSDCQTSKAYLADIQGYGMVVYDSIPNQSWRIENQLFRNTPGLDKITIANESIFLKDGVLGIALAKRNRCVENQQDNRKLYFHSLIAFTENSVPLNVINDGRTFSSQPNAFADQFKVLGDRGTHSAAQAMDSRGNLYFGLMDPIAVACWDSTLPYTKQNIRLIDRNPNTLQFAGGMKVIRNFLGDEELWSVTNRLQKGFSGTMNFDEVNFRILARPIKELFKDGKCDEETFRSSLEDYEATDDEIYVTEI